MATVPGVMSSLGQWLVRCVAAAGISRSMGSPPTKKTIKHVVMLSTSFSVVPEMPVTNLSTKTVEFSERKDPIWTQK
jgi:predicted MarR family transcription regulator